MPETFTASLTKSLEAQAKQLAHLRGIRLTEAWIAVSGTCTENLALSRGTGMESYWRAALAVCERETASALGIVERSA